jgi:hypothetical protein
VCDVRKMLLYGRAVPPYPFFLQFLIDPVFEFRIDHVRNPFIPVLPTMRFFVIPHAGGRLNTFCFLSFATR